MQSIILHAFAMTQARKITLHTIYTTIYLVESTITDHLRGKFKTYAPKSQKADDHLHNLSDLFDDEKGEQVSEVTAHLSCLHIVYPSRDSTFAGDERVVFQILDIILNTLLKVTEWKEVNGINFRYRGGVIPAFQQILDVFICECEHATISMVEDGDLARAQQLLGDNEAAEGFFAVDEATMLLGTCQMGAFTHATPPAFLMICASPSFRPR